MRKAQTPEVKKATYLKPPFVWNKGTTFNISQSFWCYLYKISGLGQESRVEYNALLTGQVMFEYLHTVLILVLDQVTEDFYSICQGPLTRVKIIGT